MDCHAHIVNYGNAKHLVVHSFYTNQTLQRGNQSMSLVLILYIIFLKIIVVWKSEILTIVKKIEKKMPEEQGMFFFFLHTS